MWELRFADGRGAGFFTTTDVTDDLGRVGAVRNVTVAANVDEATALADARRCFAEHDLLELAIHMGAVAYAVCYRR